MFKSLGKLFGASAGASAMLHPTATCPECGSKLMRTVESEPWSCPNPDCPPQVRQRLEHWCSAQAMDIVGGDSAMVKRLVESGLVRDVAELYKLKANELAALPGMSKDSGQKFFDAITASMKRDAWQALFGLAIPRVGAEEAKALGRNFRSVEDVFAAGRERIQKEAGVSEPVARGVAHWYSDPVNRKLVNRLGKAGVNFKSAIFATGNGLMPNSSR